MKKHTRKAAMVAALLLVGASVSANAAVTASVEVLGTSVGGSGDVFVRTSGTFESNGCTNTSKYLLPSSHAAKKELLAILLTAQASGTNVKIATSNGSCVAVGTPTYTPIVNIEITQ